MLTENLDREARTKFDTDLEKDPSAKPANPYDGGQNKNVMALMAAARMPQQKPFGAAD